MPWVLAIGAIAAWMFGWSTGSNDVGNAFGTSVGSGALSMRSAVIIASIFELVGAVVLSRVSTDTIAGGIANMNLFQNHPDVYAFGMMWSLIVGSVWQIGWSFYGINVSSTQIIIGCIIGFLMAYAGPDGVNWALRVSTPDVVVPYKGVLPIVLSWFISPVFTAVASAMIFSILRFCVMRAKNARNRVLWVFPVFAWVTTWINVYFVLVKGAKKYLVAHDPHWADNKDRKAAIWSVIAASIMFVIACCLIPLLKKYSVTNLDRIKKIAQVEAELEKSGAAPPVKFPVAKKPDSFNEDTSGYSYAQYGMWILRVTKDWCFYYFNFNNCTNIDLNDMEAEVHDITEKFDPRAESCMQLLQVLSAICVVFSHGAGEVGRVDWTEQNH